MSDKSIAVLSRATGGFGSNGLTDDQRRELLREIFKVADPDALLEGMAGCLNRCDESVRARFRRILGCGCDGTSSKLDLRAVVAEMLCCDPSQRLSWAEREQRQMNDGDVVDIPVVQGNGGVVNIPVDGPNGYGVAWYFQKFSVDGVVPNTASLAKVQFEIIHADRVISKFRANQWTKANCCTTLADDFKKYKRCFGWGSTWTLRITNLNALVGETFTQGTFEFVRGYPQDIAALSLVGGDCKSC